MIEIVEKIDWSILRFIQNNLTTHITDKIMIFFTTMGNVGFIWILITLFFLLSKKHRKLGFLLLIGLIVELIIGNFILKGLIMRPRPCWIDKSVSMLINIPKDYSMPSGHTFASFISATIILLYNRKWGYGALVLAILISFSRLYLYVHFPSDVFVGMILGIVLGYLIYIVFSKKLTKKLNKIEKR